MDTNSVITSPSGTMVIKPGYNRITGLAWSGHGKIAKVEISTDGAKTWKDAQLNLPALPKAHRAASRWIGFGTASRPRSSAARPTTRATSSRTASHSSRASRDQRAVSLQRPADLEHRRDREGSQCPRLAKQVFAGAIATRLLPRPSSHTISAVRRHPKRSRCGISMSGPTERDCRREAARAAHGEEVFADNCAVCHGDNGVGGIKDRLAGGQGTLASNAPVKTIGSYWPYATTLFDYMHRAMPYQAPGSLSNDDYYSLAALHSEPERHSAARRQARSRQPAEHQDAQPRWLRAGSTFRSSQSCSGRNEMRPRKDCHLRVDRTHFTRRSCNVRRWIDHHAQQLRTGRDHEAVRGRKVRQRGMTVFAHIDHAAGATAAGMPLRPTDLLIFGAAKGGTPLMQSSADHRHRPAARRRWCGKTEAGTTYSVVQRSRLSRASAWARRRRYANRCRRDVGRAEGHRRYQGGRRRRNR